MTSPLQALNENFLYNSMLARALVTLLPATDRGVIRLWLNKLHDMDESPEMMAIRNDYMWFLLLMLQSKKVMVPFKNVPPPALQPLRQILPPNTYEDILSASEQNMSWLDQAADDSGSEAAGPKTVTSHPAQFLGNQPRPLDGVLCYIAAFSDHDY